MRPGVTVPGCSVRPVVEVPAGRPGSSVRPVVEVPVRPVPELRPEPDIAVPEELRGASIRPLLMADSYLSPKVEPAFLPLPEPPLRLEFRCP